MTVLVEEKADEIIFLRKIIEGSTDKSYGIEVAKLAGIDKKIIDRANEILNEIEMKHYTKNNIVKEDLNYQFNLLDYKKEYLLEKIKNIDISKITPIEAINILYELNKEAKKLEEMA